MSDDSPTRRRLLCALGAASATIAGCLPDRSTTGGDSPAGGTTRSPATGDAPTVSTARPADERSPSASPGGRERSRVPGRVTPDSAVVDWQFDLGRAVAVSPAVHEGTVYAGTAGAEPATPGAEGTDAQRDLFAIDVDGTERWRYRTAHNVASRPAVVEDTVVIVTGASGMMATSGWGVTGLTTGGQRRWRVGTEPAELLATGDATVFVGEHEGDYGTDAFPATAVRALDPATGRKRWRRQFGKFERVAVRDGTLFVGTSRAGRSEAGLHAVDARTGRERWTRPEFLLRAVAGDALYGYRPTQEGGTLVGLGLGGDERWAVDAAPSDVFAVGDGRVYAPREGAFVATDAVDGTVRWRFDPEFDLDWAASAVFAGGTLFLAGGNGEVVALSPDGTRRWRLTEPTGRVSSVTVAGGAALLEPARMDGLVAVDAADGTERWRVHTRGEPHGPALGADRAYLASARGDLYAIPVP